MENGFCDGPLAQAKGPGIQKDPKPRFSEDLMQKGREEGQEGL